MKQNFTKLERERDNSKILELSHQQEYQLSQPDQSDSKSLPSGCRVQNILVCLFGAGLYFIANTGLELSV